MPGQEQMTVVQLPIVINEQDRKRSPYLLRGYQFTNGSKCPGTCFVLPISLGMCFIFFFIVCAFVGTSFSELFNTGPVLSVFIVLLSVAAVVIGFYFCVGAHLQFNNLPADHPDRYKYGSGYVLPDLPPQPAVPSLTNNTLTTYNFPHGAQGRRSASPSPQHYRGAGSSFQRPPEGNVYTLHGSPGSNTSLEQPPSGYFFFQGHLVAYPGQARSNPAYPPPSSTSPSNDGRRTTNNYPMAPEDDPPPPYSEIEKSNQYRY